jgi:lipopolysaccharide export system protein LptA
MFFFTSSLFSQELQDTSETSPIREEAENFVYDRLSDTKFLNGNVIMWQDSVFMFCDTAQIKEKIVIAYGNVRIIQSDTIFIFSDSIYYDGNIREADLYGSVILQNGSQEELRTEKLHYNANTKIATYDTGAFLRNTRTTLYSERGDYELDEKRAYFYKHVNVQDSSFSLRADSLIYMTDEERVIFTGPTRIDQDSSQIYCESGYYLIPQEEAFFETNAQYVKNDITATAEQMQFDGKLRTITLIGDAMYTESEKIAHAEKIVFHELSERAELIGDAFYKDNENEARGEVIFYDGKNESFRTSGKSTVSDPPMILTAQEIDYKKDIEAGYAKGKVVWQDTLANLEIHCDELFMYEKNGQVDAFGLEERPMLVSYSDEDTLYMAADTLRSVQEIHEEDTFKIFLAYYDVKIFRTDLQAVCDSLAYHVTDSIFHLFKNPVIWSDTTQFLGDSVDILLKNEQIDQVLLKEKSFIISETPEAQYNQIKGRRIEANFEDKEISDMLVEGNAESIYYLQDDENAYIGANKTICSKIRFYFLNKELDHIRYYAKPSSVLTPIQQLGNRGLTLDGFKWLPDLRPLDKEVIRWKGN